jgi:gliding motility-associated-like protein
VNAQICVGSSYTLPDGTSISVAGSYPVTLTTASGCDSIVTTNLTVNNPTASSVNAQICNGNNYTLPDGTSVSVAGSYPVTLTTANGCDSIVTVILTINNPPLLNTNSQNTNCGLSNGSINLILNGGTQPYSFNWSNSSVTEDINNLIAGNYTVTVTDAALCSATTSVLITDLSGPSLIATATNVSCFGVNDGTIVLQVIGGSAPFNYSWSNSSPNQNQNNIPAGNYSVTITDINGCSSSTSITVNEPSSLIITPTTNFATCGLSNGSINLLVSGGVGPYLFNWNNGITSEYINNLPVGDYTVTITDNSGCTTILTSNILDTSEVVVPDISVSPNEGCVPFELQITNNSQNAFSYEWNLGDGTNKIGANPTHTYTASGLYNISVVMTSLDGCIDSILSVELITVYPEVDASFNFEPNSEYFMLNNARVWFKNQSVGATNYQWNFGDGNSQGIANPYHTYADTGSFIVTLISQNNFGCLDSTSDIIHVIPNGIYFIPNTFTPNGDGKNDQFKIYGVSMKRYVLEIYDRWGENVFTSNEDITAWDGTFNGLDLNTGVFVYQAYIEYLDGSSDYIRGDVTLIK